MIGVSTVLQSLTGHAPARVDRFMPSGRGARRMKACRSQTSLREESGFPCDTRRFRTEFRI